MAWISVHEQILGGKLRSLAKEIGCSQNEAFGLLMRFWLWGIHNADKDGRIIGADRDDIADVLTIGIDSRYRPRKVVDAMISKQWIDADGDDLYIHDWDEWQEQWYKAIAVRERDKIRKREERRRAREAKHTKSAISAGTIQPEAAGGEIAMEKELILPEPINSQDEAPKSQPAVARYTKEFEEFWNAYPRKLGKSEAYKKYKARLNDGWSPKELKMAAEEYATACARKRTEKEYIKHAKTFLSDNTPFIDYLPKSRDEESAADTGVEDRPYDEWIS